MSILSKIHNAISDITGKSEVNAVLEEIYQRDWRLYQDEVIRQCCKSNPHLTREQVEEMLFK